MSRQHHRSLSTPPAGFYDIMEFFTGGTSQQRGLEKMRCAHTTATTTPTLTVPGRRTSLQSPLPCPHFMNVYKRQALPRPLRASCLLQEPFVDVVEGEGGRGILLTREQFIWGVDAVCSEICGRDPRNRPNSSLNVHDSSSTPTQVSTIFRNLFKSQSVPPRPHRHDPRSCRSLPWYPVTSLDHISSSFSNTGSISEPSQETTADDAPKSQSHHHMSPPSFRQDCLFHCWNLSSVTKEQRTHKTTDLLLSPEDVTNILGSLSMQSLLELLALIVSKGYESSFMPSYSNDFALFIQPYGKSYEDLVNLLPKLSRDLITKIVIATRHWAQYEEVEVSGRRRRRHSIESCSRDDLSLSGFGDLTPQELSPSTDPNRACLQSLASALFSNNNSSKSSEDQIYDHKCLHHGEAQSKYDTDNPIQQSTEKSLQSIGSTKVEIGNKDAMEALENLMLLHESVDQLESSMKFSDAHAALLLTPWHTTVEKVERSTLMRQEKKTVLVRKSSRKHSVSKIDRTKVRIGAQPRPHDVSAVIPPVPSRNSSLRTPDKGLYTLTEDGLTADDQYNYKTSYWQFKHRQDRARQDCTPSPCPPRRVKPTVTGTVPHVASIRLLNTESEDISLDEETCLSGSLKSDSLMDSSDSSAQSSQRSTPTTTPQLELPEFVAPPIKDLYSAPIIMDPSRLSPRTRSPTLEGGIKSVSMVTTSLSPTTAESFITKISSQPFVNQDGEECLTTAKKGWRIWEKPLLHWKRKSDSTFSTAASSLPDTCASLAPSSVDRTDPTPVVSRISLPVAINSAFTFTQTTAGAANAFPGSTNSSKRPGLGFRFQSQNDSSPSRAPRPNLNILIKETTSATSLPSSVSFSSQDGSQTTTPSPGFGCSIASIPFPEDYMSLVLSPSSSTSALWSAPSPNPISTPPNPSSPRMDNFPMVTSISPLPSPSFVSTGSRKKRFQEKLFGKKSKLLLDDTCSSSSPCSASPSMQLNRMNLLHGGVAGVRGTTEGIIEGERPVLKSASSFGSLREKKSFGQLIVPLVLAPLEQRGILKTRSRSSSSASVSAVGAASSIHGHDLDTPPPNYACHCYNPLHAHDHHHHHHHHHHRPTFHRANSQPITTPVVLSYSSSPSSTFLPKPPKHMPAGHRYHNKLPTGSVGSGVGGVSGSRDEKETNAQIWKVIDQWGAWRDAHASSK
ncbi:hypothetical protein BG015_001949 [Linnemannia schmuckeri]|uniref:Uncharacterized protein n=1 Tax=Linnemannia schmuckeri TaxID=64567 RepID=A0A9P5V6G9_9FUNG|nr:hypothetical protein BG015_001949 [Linnemannia schmuckeri]